MTGLEHMLADAAPWLHRWLGYADPWVAGAVPLATGFILHPLFQRNASQGEAVHIGETAPGASGPSDKSTEVPGCYHSKGGQP
jgi:hypothetical protein